MKIESLIKRPNGTNVSIEGTKYHFAPSEGDPRHIADVTIKGHIDIFLKNGAFKQADKPKAASEIKEVAPAAPAPAPEASTEPKADDTQNQAPVVLKGSNLEPTEIEISGVMVKTSDIAQAAFEKSGLSLEEWNALSDEEITSRMSEQAESLEKPVETGSAPAAAPAPAPEASTEPKAENTKTTRKSKTAAK